MAVEEHAKSDGVAAVPIRDKEDTFLLDCIESKLDSSSAVDLDQRSTIRPKGMVMAIRRPHSQDILDGRKPIEFRKSNFKQASQPIVCFIYEPSPTQAIVGLFTIEKLEERPVSELLDLGSMKTPSSKESLGEYYAEKDSGTAIFISETRRLQAPITLHRNNGDWAFTPPQNYYYVDPAEFAESLV